MISAKRKGNLAALMQVREHELVSGVSAKLGGLDEGPDPHELLQSALAACTIITVQMYANRKQWKLESTDVNVRIDSEGPEGTRITREIFFRGELSQEERARLLEIANKCPIHQLLTRPTTINTVAL